MRRAIVHIGLPRTGTTTLQRILSGVRPQLLAAGVLYPILTPRSAAQPHLSHQHLGEALDGRRPRRERHELLGKLADQLAKTPADTVVLSYEGLCLASPWLGVPARLAALFGRHGFAMEVLLTVKPQAELLNSTYTWRTQFLRESRSFGAYFQAEQGRAWLDPARALRGWRAASQGRIFAVATQDPRSSRPLVARVLDEIGLLPRIAGLIAAEDLALVDNRSPGPIAVAASRRLRQGGAHLAVGGARAREVTRAVELAAAASGVDEARFSGLDAASQQQATARWERANARFAQAVWGQPWGSRVAAAAAASNEVGETGADAALADEIAAEVSRSFGIQLGGGAGLALRDMADGAATRLGRMLRQARAMRL